MRTFALVGESSALTLVEVFQVRIQICLVSVMLCCAFVGCFSDAPETLPVQAVRRSTAEIVAECALCHSTQEAQRGPILHGMNAWYLLAQIQKFRAGVRGQDPDNRSAHLMGVAAKKVRNKREMIVAAKWFAEQPTMSAMRTISGDLASGATLYAARCAVCHGEKAEGKREIASPSLNRLEGWYFIDQMRKFRNGMRGRHDLDPGGQAMAAAVTDLTPRQISDVVAYVVDAFGPPKAPSLRERFLRKMAEMNATLE